MKKNNFVKNLFVLGSGTALAQIFGIVLSPVLSRIYSPEEFGTLGTVLALSGMIVSIASLKFENAIVLEEEEKATNGIQSLCISILLAITFLFSFFILFFPNVFFWLNDNETDMGYAKYAIPILFLTGLFNVYYFRLNKEEEYKLLALAQIVRRVSTIVIQILVGLLGAGALGLIFGNILGVTIPLILIFWGLKGKTKFDFDSDLFSKIWKKHKNLPTYTAPQGLVNSVMAQLPVLVLSAQFGMTIAGIYYFAAKIVQLPASFMGQAVRTVYYREASKQKNDYKANSKLLQQTILGLVAVIIIPILLLIFKGPDLFALAFGEQWREAGLYSSWLMIWFGSNFVQSPCRTLFLVYQKEKNLLILDTVLGVFRSIVLIIGSIYFNALFVVAMYSMVSFFFFSGTIIFWLIYLKRKS